MTNLVEVKYKFCDELDGDLNARLGTDDQTWEEVIGSEDVGKCNSNGPLRLRKCPDHDLLIANTGFRLPNKDTLFVSRSHRLCHSARNRHTGC